MTIYTTRDDLHTYDPVDLRRLLAEQETVVTRAIHAFELAATTLRRVHVSDEPHRTAAELRAAVVITLNAILGINELTGCFEMAAHMDAISLLDR